MGGPVSGDHGYSRYADGCRCDVCRAAKAAYMRARRAEAKANVLQDGPNYVPYITHGIGGYTNHLCRCFTCRTAKREQDRRDNARRTQRRRADA
jgi:hypothetical protein